MGADGNHNKYDETGEPIVYSIEEEKVQGYQTEVDGYNLINRHEPTPTPTPVPPTPTPTPTEVLPPSKPVITGDEANLTLWSMMAAGSLLILATAWLLSRKKNGITQ